MPEHTYYTIGHSTRTVAELASLLLEAGCDLVIDVRTIPRSRTNPQFNHDVIASALAPYGIGYHPLRALGGLRGHRRGAGPSPNAFWTNASFRNYADYALSAEFREGLAALRGAGEAHTCVWWRCHRRIIADYLIAAGVSVRHILGAGHIEPAPLTQAARRQPDGSLLYPAPDPE